MRQPQVPRRAPQAAGPQSPAAGLPAARPELPGCCLQSWRRRAETPCPSALPGAMRLSPGMWLCPSRPFLWAWPGLGPSAAADPTSSTRWRWCLLRCGAGAGACGAGSGIMADLLAVRLLCAFCRLAEQVSALSKSPPHRQLLFGRAAHAPMGQAWALVPPQGGAWQWACLMPLGVWWICMCRGPMESRRVGPGQTMVLAQRRKLGGCACRLRHAGGRSRSAALAGRRQNLRIKNEPGCSCSTRLANVLYVWQQLHVSYK